MADLCDKCVTGQAIKNVQREKGLRWMKRHLIKSAKLVKPCLSCKYSDAPGVEKWPKAWSKDNFVEAKL